MRIFRLLFPLLWLLAGAGARAESAAAHVVLVVWDGMRPDFVKETTTPTLFRMAHQGVTFMRHHPVYVSSTEVNATALATGVYPQVSGVIGNNEYRPAINPNGAIMTAAPQAVREGDRVTGNHFLRVPTLPELLRGRGLGVVIGGAKTVSLLFDRQAADSGAPDIDIFEGNVLPESLAAELRNQLGAFPPVDLPKRERDLWTTRALLGPLWDKGLPALSVLWLSEPDYSQHKTGPGSKTSLDAIRSSDENLERVLTALDRLNARESTDVIVVSDHAFSTVSERIDVATELRRNGFHAARSFSDAGPQPGDIQVTGNGGSVFFYVSGRDRELTGKLVRFLQAQPFCGVLFTRERVEGAFRLADAKINSADAPDVVLSMHWSVEKSRTGTPGMVMTDAGEYGPGQGMHATLSPFDMHNTCVAAGPHFKEHFQDQLPTGNVDVVPTILAILGVEPEHKLSGRVLTEALRGPMHAIPVVEHKRLETNCRGENFRWQQYLDSSQVNGVVYLNHGNGRVEKR